jgi:hypothetical protein
MTKRKKRKRSKRIKPKPGERPPRPGEWEERQVRLVAVLSPAAAFAIATTSG